MKTTEELINSTNLTFDDWEVIKELMIIFAKEAIKEDRKNLLEHIEINYTDKYGEKDISIDKDSVLNAPQIELL